MLKETTESVFERREDDCYTKEVETHCTSLDNKQRKPKLFRHIVG